MRSGGGSARRNTPITMSYPIIIQGGMGTGVSNWRLARTVSQLGQLGVVSGTAIDVIVARRLQEGDPGGHLRRAFDHFPFPEIANRVWEQHFIPGGKAPGDPFRPLPLLNHPPLRSQVERLVVANFAEVYLAREGHSGAVGINYLQKVQLPTLPSIFGALLAGVDYVLMGAGIPMAIPGVLDQLAAGQPARLKIEVEGAEPGDEFVSTFDPVEFCGGTVPPLRRPKFLGIISSYVLALTLARKASGRVDGFVVEGPTAGGHNAPPGVHFNSMTAASRCTAIGMSPTWKRSAISGYPSGLPVPTPPRNASPRRVRPGPPESRWAPPLRSVTNPAWKQG